MPGVETLEILPIKPQSDVVAPALETEEAPEPLVQIARRLLHVLTAILDTEEPSNERNAEAKTRVDEQHHNKIDRAAAIVEIEIASDRGTCVRHALVGVQIDLLVLHRPPEPLDEHVVPPSALSVHADRDIVLNEHAGEGCTREWLP